nr:SRPBCC family protein [Rhizobium leguminosarum]
MPKRDGSGPYGSTHTAICEAPAHLVFPFISQPSHWPRIFKACLAVETLPSNDEWQLVRVHADQDGGIASWTTRRKVDADALIVDYQLVEPMPFTAAMSGRWRIVPIDQNRCLLAVDRSWSVADPVAPLREDITNVEEAAAFVARFVGTNARHEMEVITAIANDHAAAPLFVETSIDLPVSADEIYLALANAAAWPDFAPHCRSLKVSFDDGVYQEMRFEIETPSGARETFRSFRVCDRINRRISFVQIEPPQTLEHHHGLWSVETTPTGSRVTCRHFVTPKRAALAEYTGRFTQSEQDEALRQMIETNGRVIIDACAAHIRASLKEPAA